MSEFWWGVVLGAALAGVLGGPVATRVSARLERRWDRRSEESVAGDRAMAAQIQRLAADPGLLRAYQAQYWTWAAIVGGIAVALAVVGFLIAWSFGRADQSSASAVVAALTAILAAGIAMFWSRKLIAKRRITRLVYRRTSEASSRRTRSGDQRDR